MSAMIRRPSAAIPVAVSLFSTLFTLTATPAAAQVSGAVVFGSDAVRGAVVVGQPLPPPRPVVVYQPVYGRRVMVARYVPQPVYIESGHGRHGKTAAWYRRHGYQPVTLYFAGGRYYTQAYAVRGYRYGPRFTPVIVWERKGRFYLPSDGWPGEYGFVSSYQDGSSPGFVYEYEGPEYRGRDWDE